MLVNVQYFLLFKVFLLILANISCTTTTPFSVNLKSSTSADSTTPTSADSTTFTSADTNTPTPGDTTSFTSADTTTPTPDGISTPEETTKSDLVARNLELGNVFYIYSQKLIININLHMILMQNSFV